jgi:hypothetical protein
MEIRPFTLIATCRKKSECPPELFNEFSLVLNLCPYSRSELQAIAISMGEKSGISVGPDVAEIVARCSGSCPRSLETSLLRLARSIGKSILTREEVLQALAAFGTNVGSEGLSSEAESIGDLSGVDFERLIVALLTQMGFQAEMTKLSGDGGIDIVAHLDRPIIGGRYLFQCKRFAPDNLVGAPTIRDFYGAVTADRAVKGVFVTTSDFTPQAREFAEKTGLELINLAQLRQLLGERGLTELRH